MIGWFGESWGAPVCEPKLHVDTPVGTECVGHEHMHTDDRPDTIQPGDQGITLPQISLDKTMHLVVYHLDCWLHEVGADRL